MGARGADGVYLLEKNGLSTEPGFAEYTKGTKST